MASTKKLARWIGGFRGMEACWTLILSEQLSCNFLALKLYINLSVLWSWRRRIVIRIFYGLQS
ncbi:hypothetical protein [Prochlorococcus sp. MIT 1318]|uniref:hypothetical protein n=1 Tax=Prochlorococcus sp. MIT 1318 TaxID=3082531 RepID=UPI0039B50CB8